LACERQITEARTGEMLSPHGASQERPFGSPRAHHPLGARCQTMRILLWHGYLLDGTGSNVYSRALARECSLARHDVTVVSQEPSPERYDLGSAATARPELPGGLLPVFVLARYPGGLDARLLQDLTAKERRR